MEIACENISCIYERDNYCMLSEISINEIGICEECILVDIPEKDLYQYKREHLRRLKEQEDESFSK